MMHCSGRPKNGSCMLSVAPRLAKQESRAFNSILFAKQVYSCNCRGSPLQKRKWARPAEFGRSCLFASLHVFLHVSLILWWLWAHWPGFLVLCVSVCLFMCFFICLFIVWISLSWRADFSSLHTCDRNLCVRMTASTLSGSPLDKKRAHCPWFAHFVLPSIPWSFANTGVIRDVLWL